MDDDLIVFSWNLERKTEKTLTSDRDALTRIVSGMVDTISQGDQGEDTPFVGFLLEMKGQGAGVQRMCDLIRDEYRRQTRKEITVTGRDTDGLAHTAESIIVVSQGVEVASSTFDVQEGLKAYTELDKIRSFAGLDEHQRVARRFNLRDNRHKHTQHGMPKASNYRKIEREPEWYRNGVIADVKRGGKIIRLASIHAPGPNFSKAEGLTDSIIQSAVGHNVDVLIGDLNRSGSLQSERFDDLSKSWTTGTTFGRNAPTVLGPRRRDRVLAAPGRTFEIESPNPVAITRDPSLGLARLTDHALVYARITDRVVPELNFGSVEPFSNQTGKPGPAGVDLHSLASSKALIQPADPTLLYAAASDRKNPSDEQLQKQLKKQLDENPFTSNASDPASDPLGSPSATSPLSEPPAASGVDEAMEESAEAMEAMAAEGEEVAEVAEVLLL